MIMSRFTQRVSQAHANPEFAAGYAEADREFEELKSARRSSPVEYITINRITGSGFVSVPLPTTSSLASVTIQAPGQNLTPCAHYQRPTETKIVEFVGSLRS